MHDKRKKARNAAPGCKPWKVNGFVTARRDGEKFADHCRRHAAARDISEARLGERLTPLLPKGTLYFKVTARRQS